LSGPTAVNPFVFGSADVETPYLPDLIAGAEIFGFIDGIAEDADLNTLLDFDLNSTEQNAPPANALVAIYRVDSGFEDLLDTGTAIDFSGHDMLLMINLTDLNLEKPRLGVHLAGSADTSLDAALGYDGLHEASTVTLDVLNAGAVWATLIPEAAITVNASINGQVINIVGKSDLTTDSVTYITADRGTLADAGPAGTLSDFSGLAELVEARDGKDLLALAENRDAILIIDPDTLVLRQVIENGYDGIQDLTELRHILTSADGKHVYVQSGETDLLVFERDADARILEYVGRQTLDPGLTKYYSPIEDGDYTVRDIVINDLFDTTVVWFSYDFGYNDGDDRDEDKIKTFVRDPDTGFFTTLTKADGPVLVERDITNTTDRTIYDIELIGNSLLVLNDQGINVFGAGYPYSSSLLVSSSGFSAAGYGFTGATELQAYDNVPNTDFLHVLNPTEGSFVTFKWEIFQDQVVTKVMNDENGVSGLDGLSSVAQTLDGAYFFAVGSDADSVPVFEGDSGGTMVQKLVNDTAGVTGLVNPTDALGGVDGSSIYVATLGDDVVSGGLVRFSLLGDVGNALVERENVDEVVTLNVLDDPFGPAEGILTGFRYVPLNTAADFPTSLTPLLLEKDGEDWKITGIGRSEDAGDPTGLGFAQRDFELVAGSAQTSNKYFGWLTLPDSELPGGIGYDDGGAQVIHLDLSEHGISDPGGLALNQIFTGAGSTTLNRTYAVQAGAVITEVAASVRAQFSDIEGLTVGTGGGEDNLTLAQAPVSTVLTLGIDTGANNDRVVIEDLSPTTTVNLGADDDTAEIATSTSATLNVRAGSGVDTIELIRVGSGAVTDIDGEDGDDFFQVAGDQLALGTTTNIDGGDHDSGDTLEFDPGDPNATLDPNEDPHPTEEREVGVDGLGHVDFSRIETKEVIAAPQITFDPLADLPEGNALTLGTTVIPNGSGNALDRDLEWSINGSAFGAETGDTLSLSWTDLGTKYGIWDDGSYQIKARATNLEMDSRTEAITLTVTNVAPVIELTASATAYVGRPYSISFESVDIDADTPEQWIILWGDGKTSAPGANDTQASHIYTDPHAGRTITIQLVDDDSDPAVAQTITTSVQVTVDPADISAGGSYSIEEGQDLTLTATAVGTPTAYGWDFDPNDADSFIDATGANPTLTWAQLVALGIDDSATGIPVTLQVTYADGSTPTDATTLEILNLDPFAASFTNDAPGGMVDEGTDGATVRVTFGGAGDPAVGDVNAGLRFSYDFNNDGIFEITDSASASVFVPESFQGPAGGLVTPMGDAGLVTVSGRVSDQDGGYFDLSTSFQVNEVGISFGLSAGATVAEGQSFSLTITNPMDPGVGDAITGYLVDWGDGQASSTDDPAMTSFTHAYDDDEGGAATRIKVTVLSVDDSLDHTHDVIVTNTAPTFSGVALDSTSIVEGGVVELTGDMADQGRGDGFVLEIDWGDGVIDTLDDIDPGTTSFGTVHRYEDDGSYVVSASLSDDDGAMATGTFSDTVTVSNAAPTLQLALIEDNIDETGTAVLSGTISDVGVNDSFTVTVDWGDGNLIPVSVSGNSFRAERIFADDDPTASTFDLVPVDVIVTDTADPASIAQRSATLTVFNLDPTLFAATSSALDTGTWVEAGETVTVEAVFKDFGLADTHTVSIDWGDGNTTTDADATVDVTFDPADAVGTVSAQHTYATAGVYPVVITLTDDDLGESIFTIQNTPPTVRLTDTTDSVAEDDNLGQNVRVATVVITDDGYGTNNLSLSGTDADLFTIVSDADVQYLELRAGVELAAETQPQLSVTVEVDDPVLGSTFEDSVTFTLLVTDDINLAPTLALTNVRSTSISDNEAAAAPVTVATVEITDDFDGTNTLDLTGDDAALFEIADDNGEQVLRIRQGSVLSAASNPVLDVTVTLDDPAIGSGLEGSEAVSFSVVAADGTNDFAPVLDNVALNVEENTADDTVIATLVATDDDATNGGLGYSIIGGNGLGIFALDTMTGELTIADKTNLDRESVSQVTLTVEVTDNGPGTPLTDTATITIDVDDVNEFAPVLDDSGLSVTEGSGIGTAVGTMAGTDADATNGGLSYSITNGNGLGIFDIDGASGEITVADSAALDAAVGTQVVLTVTVSDNGPGGALTDPATVTIDILADATNQFPPV
ncbi:MAG: hypothetical protein GY925_28695, partial [Actinomycetia bacterium]|nr:hypothetical protein [Actinomycetes bacterium]